jgi:hypothetical protein
MGHNQKVQILVDFLLTLVEFPSSNDDMDSHNFRNIPHSLRHLGFKGIDR